MMEMFAAVHELHSLPGASGRTRRLLIICAVPEFISSGPAGPFDLHSLYQGTSKSRPRLVGYGKGYTWGVEGASAAATGIPQDSNSSAVTIGTRLSALNTFVKRSL